LRTMGRAPALLAVLGAVTLTFGCGGSETDTTSDGQLAKALNLQKADDNYTVGDNLLCSVQDLLNDSTEVSDLTQRQKKVAITSKNGELGVLITTPFAPACAREVKEGLNKLSRKQGK